MRAVHTLGQETTTYLLNPGMLGFGQTAMGLVPLDGFVATYIVR